MMSVKCLYNVTRNSNLVVTHSKQIKWQIISEINCYFNRFLRDKLKNQLRTFNSFLQSNCRRKCEIDWQDKHFYIKKR